MMKNKLLKIILIIAGILITGILLITPIQFKIANSYIKRGNENLKNHFYKSAFLNYEKASALLPDDEELKIQLGKIYLLKGNLDGAEKEFRKATKINKDNSKAHSNLIRTLLLEKKLKEAENFLNNMSKKASQDSDVQIQAARVYASLGKIDDALTILKNNTKSEANFYKSLFYITKKEFAKAENLLKDINSEQTNLKDDFLKINAAFEKINNSENETYKTVVLAQTLNEIDEPYLAEMLLKEVLEKNPDYRDAFIFLGYVKFLKKDLKEARNLLLKALEKDQIYGLSYYFLGKVDLAENKKEEAGNNFQKALEFGYRNKQSYKSLGEIKKQAKNFKEAEEDFKKALEYDQNDEEILLNLVEVMIAQKKIEEAESEALKNESNSLLGWIYLEKGELEKSLEHLKKAEKDEPYSAFVVLKLGELLEKQNKSSEAKEYFQKVIEYDLTGEWAKEAEQQLK